MDVSSSSSDEEPDVNFQISKYFNTIKAEENTGASTSGLQTASTSKLQSVTTSVHYKSPVSDCFSGRPTLKSPMASLTISTDPLATSSTSSTSQETEVDDYEAECLKDVALLDKGISVNIQMTEKYDRLIETFTLRLKEARIKLQEIRHPEATDEATTSFRYIHCGKPYFKDTDLTPAPCNEDTLKMKSLGMYDLSNLRTISGWTVKDKSDFSTLLLKMSQQKKIQELKSSIADIQAGKSDIKYNVMDSVIDKMTNEIAAIAKKDLKELALPISEEYDWETIASLLKHRHSASEYRSLWKLFLHPSINKGTWSTTERENLLKIAKANQFQNWDKIAADLNTGRSGYQCFVYYRTNVKTDSVGRKWTKEEEDVLKKTVEYYREGDYIPWGKVAASMKNRTKISIYNKYIQSAKTKGRFCPEEDSIILACVKKFGANFTNIKKHLPGRTRNQIRNRYQTLKKTRVSTVWTVEEDKKLVQLMANQDGENTDYSGMSKLFPGKDRTNLRTRYQTLSKWIKCNPHLDISFAPRRGARRLVHGSPAEDLNKAVETLEAKIFSKDTQKKSKAITAASSEQDIEDAIVACLTTEAINEEDKYHDEIPINLDKPNHSLKASNVNINNLQTILILLRSQINAESFRNSKDYEKFRGLDDCKQTVSTVTIKSYSRKKAVETVKRNIPDIYGSNRLPTLEYILPPNYDTLTACRIFIKYVSENQPNARFVARLMNNKNQILKQQLSLLTERFNTLYIWPLLLSKRDPPPLHYIIDSKEDPQLGDVFKNVKIESIKTLQDSDDETKDENLK